MSLFFDIFHGSCMQVIFSLKNPSDEKEGEMMNWTHKIGCDTTENNKMLNFHNTARSARTDRTISGLIPLST